MCYAVIHELNSHWTREDVLGNTLIPNNTGIRQVYKKKKKKNGFVTAVHPVLCGAGVHVLDTQHRTRHYI